MFNIARKKTNDEFLQEVFNLVEDEYTFLEEYVTARIKIKVRHNLCGNEYYVNPNHFLHGRRCPNCSTNYKKTDEQFKEDVYNLVEDEYTFLEKYINIRTELQVRHNVCGHEYSVIPNNFLNGSKCPKCSGKKKRTNEEFRQEIYNLVGDEYTFLDRYINTNTPIKVKHNICGYEYLIAPTNFINGGRRCRKCNGTAKKTNEEFIAEIKDLVDDEYTFLEPYITADTKIQVKHNICNNIYETTPTNFLQGHRCKKCSCNGISKLEKELLSYIKTICLDPVIENDRTILNGKEIDILIPSKNIGFELNGLYWHSSEFKTKKCHLEKTLMAKEKGIKLIHIFEDEWNEKEVLIKKKIAHLLGVDNSLKIFARKCIVKKIVKTPEKTKFLNENHLQGADRCNFSYGLYYNEELVALMSYVKPRINMGKKNKDIRPGEYELSRYATKYNVVGGFNKLLKYIKEHEDITEIYTYADLRWTSPDDNIYLKNGFEYVSISQPNYWYIINGVREGRFSYQKARLQEKFPEIYSDNKTEEQIMLEAGYYKIYDCGNLKYSKKL